MLLSVVVCTYNQQTLLQTCLESLVEQTLAADRFEVIIVDNNSTDGTAQVAARYVEAHDHFRYVFEPVQGLSRARNRGYAEAKGSYLIYIDDDAQAPPDYLANVYAVIDAYAPDIIGGPIYPYYTTDKPGWFRDDFEIRQYETRSGFSTKCLVSGSNFVIKRSLLKELGLFDPSLGMKGDQMGQGEERKVLETYRMRVPVGRQRVYYATHCKILHHVPPYKMDVRYQMKRYYSGGRMNVVVEGRHQSLKGIVSALLSPPYHLVRIIYMELRDHGLRGFSWAQVARMGAFYWGRIVEIVNQLFGGAGGLNGDVKHRVG